MKGWCVWVKVCSTIILTKIGCEVKVRICIWTLPCFHVENRVFHSRKSTIIYWIRWSWYANFYSIKSWDIGKAPLIRNDAFSINCWEICQTHNKVVDKGFWNFNEASCLICFPNLINNGVFFRARYIIWVKDYHWKL